MEVKGEQVQRAAKALVDYVRKQAAEKPTRNLLEDTPGGGDVIQVQISLRKIPDKVSRRPQHIDIPHPIRQQGLCEMCLFLGSKLKPELALDLKNNPIEGLTKVITKDKFSSELRTFQMRRELMAKYDLFLCDDRITPVMTKALGKTFMAARKQPVPVKIKSSEGLAKAVDKARRGTFLIPSYGVCWGFKVATTDMPTDQVAENVLAALPQIVQKVPGGWKNIQGLHLQVTASISLPFYSAILERIAPAAASPVATGKKSGAAAEDAAGKKKSAKKGPKVTQERRKMKNPLLKEQLRRLAAGEALTPAAIAAAVEERMDEDEEKDGDDVTAAPAAAAAAAALEPEEAVVDKGATPLSKGQHQKGKSGGVASDSMRGTKRAASAALSVVEEMKALNARSKKAMVEKNADEKKNGDDVAAAPAAAVAAALEPEEAVVNKRATPLSKGQQQKGKNGGAASDSKRGAKRAASAALSAAEEMKALNTRSKKAMVEKNEDEKEDDDGVTAAPAAAAAAALEPEEAAANESVATPFKRQQLKGKHDSKPATKRATSAALSAAEEMKALNPRSNKAIEEENEDEKKDGDGVTAAPAAAAAAAPPSESKAPAAGERVATPLSLKEKKGAKKAAAEPTSEKEKTAKRVAEKGNRAKRSAAARRAATRAAAKEEKGVSRSRKDVVDRNEDKVNDGDDTATAPAASPAAAETPAQRRRRRGKNAAPGSANSDTASTPKQGAKRSAPAAFAASEEGKAASLEGEKQSVKGKAKQAQAATDLPMATRASERKKARSVPAA